MKLPHVIPCICLNTGATIKSVAESCPIIGIKVLKCVEGQFNKAFLMTTNDGTEILAKIPNPNAAPAIYTTASEVATRDFVHSMYFVHLVSEMLISKTQLRKALNFLVPRIINYSRSTLNPVGIEYILEEKARGEE